MIQFLFLFENKRCMIWVYFIFVQGGNNKKNTKQKPIRSSFLNSETWTALLLLIQAHPENFVLLLFSVRQRCGLAYGFYSSQMLDNISGHSTRKQKRVISNKILLHFSLSLYSLLIITPQQMSESFEEWIKGSTLDPRFGFLYPKSYKPTHFNPAPITKCLKDLIRKIESKTFCKEVENMEDPQLVLETKGDKLDDKLVKDCFLLHGLLNKILSSYLLQKSYQNVPNSQIVIPKNLGVPLYRAANFLKIKLGLTTDFHLNWGLPGYDCSESLPSEFRIDEVRLTEHFSSHIKDEDLFFGGGVLGSHYLFKSMKTLYRINQNILNAPFESQQQNIVLLNNVRKSIKSMVDSNIYLLNNLQIELFSDDKFRFSFGGFKNLKFQEIQERLSSSGGAGGYDPSFQLFQRMMDIHYEGGLKSSQQIFQQGFPQPIRKLLSSCKGKFLIKQYCDSSDELKEAYNLIIKEYTDFYYVHRQLINKFILYKDKNIKTGTAEVNLKDIIERDNSIAQQKL